MDTKVVLDEKGFVSVNDKQQTADPAIKRRCLDSIDSMVELNFGGMSFELSKLES